MQHFSRYGRSLSRMSGKRSAHAINQQIDAMTVRRLQDIQPGDLVRYAGVVRDFRFSTTNRNRQWRRSDNHLQRRGVCGAWNKVA